MTNWKQGDKCLIRERDSGALFQDCEILYIDSIIVVFSCSAASSLPKYLSDVELIHIKTPAEIERDRVIELALDAAMAPNLTRSVSDTIEITIYRLDNAGLLSDPTKRVKGISFDDFYHDLYSNKTYQETYNKWIKDGIIQGVDSNG